MSQRVVFTVKVYGAAHETHAQTLAHIAQACQGAAHDARAAGGGKLSGVILADGAVEIGSWQYSPSASAS
jgi:hypothetical protein